MNTNRRGFLASLAAAWSWLRWGEATASPASPPDATAGWYACPDCGQRRGPASNSCSYCYCKGLSSKQTGQHNRIVDDTVLDCLAAGAAVGYGWDCDNVEYPNGTIIAYRVFRVYIDGEEVFKYSLRDNWWLRAGDEWWIRIHNEEEKEKTTEA